MSSLKTLNALKYEALKTAIESKRRRDVETHKDDLVRINEKTNEWLLAVIAGDSATQVSALAELSEIYGTTVDPPDSVVGSTVNELNTRDNKGLSLSAGLNTVTFSSAFKAEYGLIVNCYTSQGGMVQHSQDPDTRTINGFQIVCAAACLCDYFAY